MDNEIVSVSKPFNAFKDSRKGQLGGTMKAVRVVYADGVVLRMTLAEYQRITAAGAK